MALKQALLIEHLFRHGARSVLWHVGEQLRVRAGETLCHITYLDMSCSLACITAHCRALPAETRVHASRSMRQQMREPSTHPQPPPSSSLESPGRTAEMTSPNVVAVFKGPILRAERQRQIFWQHDFIRASQTDTEASFQIITTHLF